MSSHLSLPRFRSNSPSAVAVNENERGAVIPTARAVSTMRETPKTVTPPKGCRSTRSVDALLTSEKDNSALHFPSDFEPTPECSDSEKISPPIRIVPEANNLPSCDDAKLSRCKRHFPLNEIKTVQDITSSLTPKRRFLLQKLTISSPATSSRRARHLLDSPEGDSERMTPDNYATTTFSSSQFNQSLGHGQESPFDPVPPRFQHCESGTMDCNIVGGPSLIPKTPSPRQVPVRVLSRNGCPTPLSISMRLSNTLAASNNSSSSLKSPYTNSHLMRSLGHEDSFSPVLNPRPRPPLPGIALAPRNNSTGPKFGRCCHVNAPLLDGATFDSKDLKADFNTFFGRPIPDRTPKYTQRRNHSDRSNPIEHVHKDDIAGNESMANDEPLTGNSVEKDYSSFILGLPRGSNGEANKRLASLDEKMYYHDAKRRKPLDFRMLSFRRMTYASTSSSIMSSSTSLITNRSRRDQTAALQGILLLPTSQSELSLDSLACSVDSAIYGDTTNIESRDFATSPPIRSSPTIGHNAISPPSLHLFRRD